MKIADIELGEKPLFLAPMEDVTDPSFRYMCKRFGADVVTTEFISSDGLIRDAWKSRAKLNIDEAERPVGIQIYGHLIEPMVEAARIAESAHPDFIDINFGENEYEEYIDDLARRMHFADANEFFAAIGYGGVLISKLLPRIRDDYTKRTNAAKAVEIKTVAPKRHASSEGVVVEGIDNCLVKLSKLSLLCA